MVERGVQPDLLLIGANQSAQAIVQNESIHALEAGGMALRSMVDADGEWLVRHRTVLSRTGCFEVYLPAANAAELRALDERVLAILPADDPVRRRWMQRVRSTCAMRGAADAGYGCEEELKRLSKADFQD
jgi:hypothetical protein